MPDRINRTTKELAEYLRRSERTLIRWRYDGRGPAYFRMGGKVLYPSDLTEEWLESKRHNPVREKGAA